MQLKPYAVLAALLLAAPCYGQSQLTTYRLTAERLNVEVDMPDEPRVASMDRPNPMGVGNPLKIKTWTAESSCCVYHVATYDLANAVTPNGPDGGFTGDMAKDMLEGAMKDAVGSMGGAVMNEVATSCQGYPARDAVLVRPNYGLMTVRFIMVRSRALQLFLLARGVEPGDEARYCEATESAKRFFGSLQILE